MLQCIRYILALCSSDILEHLQQAEAISYSKCKLLQAIKHSYKGRCYLVLLSV